MLFLFSHKDYAYQVRKTGIKFKIEGIEGKK